MATPNYSMGDPSGEYAAGLGQRFMVAQGTDDQWMQDYANQYNRFLTDPTNGGLYGDFSTQPKDGWHRSFGQTFTDSYGSPEMAVIGNMGGSGGHSGVSNMTGGFVGGSTQYGGSNGAATWRRTMAADARERAMFEANRDMPAEVMAQIMRGGEGNDRAKVAFLRNQYKLQQDRANMTKRVQGYYNDPNRDAKMAGGRKRLLDNNLSQIATQYNNARVGAAQQMAGQGLQGSSVDVQRRGDLARSKASATASAYDQSYRMADDQKRIDQGQLGALMELINSDNPATVRGVQAQLQGLDDQGQMYEQIMANNMEGQQVNAFGNRMYSQVAGQTLSGLAGAARQYSDGYGQGY